jgi:membrane protein
MLRTAWEIGSTTVRSWMKDDVFRWAAAVAFYTVFSLAPILLISVGIAGLVFSEEKAKRQIVHEIEGLTGPEGGKVAEQVFDSMADMERSPRAITLGLIAIVVGSTAVFANLQAALNHIWSVQPKRNRSAFMGLLRVRLRSFGIVIAVGFLLLVSMVISALISGLQTFMPDRLEALPLIWQTLNFFISWAIITFLFAMIYKYLPDVKVSWRHVLLGAAITSILFSLGKSLIGIYFGQVAVGSAYGAAGSFVVLLIWIYYSALVCFLGAEFTQVYARRYDGRVQPANHAEKKNIGD